eukprot:11221052-Lingulodinium_polyedra.AAC.1
MSYLRVVCIMPWQRAAWRRLNFTRNSGGFLRENRGGCLRGKRVEFCENVANIFGKRYNVLAG